MRAILWGMRHATVFFCLILFSMSLLGQNNQNILSEAREHAKAGRVDEAFAALGRATAPAPGIARALNTSDDFKALRDDVRFQPLVQKLTPCASPEYHQFDFWIGDWEVRGKNGQILGHNHISKRHGGCVV